MYCMAINGKQPEDQVFLKGLLSSSRKEVDAAVMQLYETYYPTISGYLLKRGFEASDIQDIFQDGILAFLNALKKGKVKGDGNAGGYFFTVCKHLAFKKGTRGARMPLDSTDIQSLEVASEDWSESEEEKQRNQLRIRSWKLMESLGKPCAKLLRMSFEENRKIVSFFAELGYKNAQVARTAKYKCLKRLRDKLSKDPFAQSLIRTLFT